MSANIEHEGVVRSVIGGRALIAVQTGGCSGCGHQSGCGLARLAGNRSQALINLAVDENVRPGARVSLTLSEGRMSQGALVGYFLPALAMVVGAGVGFGTLGSDAAAAAGMALGLGVGLVLTRTVAARISAPHVDLLPEETPGKPQFRPQSAIDKMPESVRPHVGEVPAP